MSRFDESLVLDRWKNAYANNGPSMELGNIIGCDNTNDACINVQDELPQRKIWSEAQKYKKALKTAQALASVASEGGMKTFNERMVQMQALLESWQTGKPFHLIEASMHSIPRNVSEKIDNLFSENDTAAFPSRENNEAIFKTSLQINKKNQAGSKETLQATKHSNEEKQVNIADYDASEFADVKMPVKMLKRGRPKGSGLTVIGLPKAKKSKTDNSNIVPFSKLTSGEKDRLLLECFVSPLTAKQALSGVQIQNRKIEANPLKIPDLARDESVVDVNRIEKYFVNEGWLIVLGALAKKRKFPWICPGCAKPIKTSQDSVACERCLNWYHFPCVALQKKPKTKNWFCRNCKNKYR